MPNVLDRERRDHAGVVRVVAPPEQLGVVGIGPFHREQALDQAGRAVHLERLAVGERRERRLDADDRRNAELARHDGGVLEDAADLRDDGRCHREQRDP